MINNEDQEQLFKLIAEYIDADIECIAIGGTAMMFSGYKNATKDIDIVFQDEKDRQIFVKAIIKLGYTERSIREVYDKKRAEHKGKPKMYSRGEERFDLFVKNVFGFKLDARNITQRHDFIGKKELIIKILSKEYLMLLKAITLRDKDLEDIETIIEKEKNIDWEFIVKEAIIQKENNQWILYDLEETLLKLSKKTLIKKKYFDMIYAAAT
jgi:hypothetical protein